MNMIDFVFSNWELIAVGIVMNLTVVLGFVVYWSKKESATHIAFLCFSLAVVLWATLNYLSFQPFDTFYALLILRLTLFAATWFTFFFLYLTMVFPREQTQISSILLWALGLWTATVSLAATTPSVLREVTALTADGAIASVSNGAFMPVFGMTTLAYAAGGIMLLAYKTLRARTVDRARFLVLSTGLMAMLFAVATTNFILPVLLGNASYLPFAALFIFPFLVLTSYAIMRLHLLDIKVVGTEIFTSFLLVISIIQLAQSRGIAQVFIQLLILAGLVVASLLLIRSVLREIEQRELIQKQEKELEIVNAQQETLLHFISHEVKGYLTNSEAAFASITEEDFGPVDPRLKTMAQSALMNTRKGVATIMDILKASDMKQGTVSYKKAPLDFRIVVQNVVAEQKRAAYEKHLGFELNIAEGVYKMEGDEDKLRDNVIRNLIDNAIRYTPAGTIRVELSQVNGPSTELRASKIRFSVKDNGVGITPEDMARLFTEGGHGKDSIKTNVHSTGYGLFIAKQVVDVHGGKIWAESEGGGKGAKFIVELPAA